MRLPPEKEEGVQHIMHKGIGLAEAMVIMVLKETNHLVKCKTPFQYVSVVVVVIRNLSHVFIVWKMNFQSEDRIPKDTWKQFSKVVFFFS